MSALTGTLRLTKLALRRDRLKLAVWLLAIAGLTAAVTSGISAQYETTEQRISAAVVSAANTSTRIVHGPIDGPSLGSFTMLEFFLFGAIAAALMSSLAVIRHTRQNEETGRAELVGSAVVGRQAPLMAAFIITAGANILLAALIFLVLTGIGQLAAVGSLGLAAAVAAIGLSFGAIGAIAAQLSASARGANSLAALAVGVAFLLRAGGDSLGTINPGGMSVTSQWLSWISPIGWGQQLQPFTQGRWWIFSLFALAIFVLAGAAFAMNHRRDVGLSLLPDRRGPKQAAAWLLNPFGLAWRLQRGSLAGWTAGFIAFGLLLGSSATQFEKLAADNPNWANYLAGVSGGGNVTDMFLSVLIGLGGVIAAAYNMQGLLRLRGEEAAGHLESLLGTAIGRTRWVLSHVLWVTTGTITLLAVFGISMGLAYALAADAPWTEIISLSAAALVRLPAVLAVTGGTVLLFGLLPRWTASAWAGFVSMLIVNLFADVLKLPQWAINLSPFSHIPNAPAEAVAAAPILTLLAISAGLALAGLISFRRRNLTTS